MRRVRPRPARQFIGQREREAERCSAANFVLCPKRSSIAFDDCARDREPQSRALRLGREKGLEDPVQIRLWNALARIETFSPTADAPLRNARTVTLRSFGSQPWSASMLFSTRFRITCCRWILSPLTGNASRAGASVNLTPRFVASAAAILPTSRTVSFRSDT